MDVHGYDAPAGTATFRLFVWTVGADRGNASVDGPIQRDGGHGRRPCRSAGRAWRPACYLGLITHTDGATTLDQTVIEITAP